MSDTRVIDLEKHFCDCEKFQLCPCINPPHHCALCGRELTAEQLIAARAKGTTAGLENSICDL